MRAFIESHNITGVVFISGDLYLDANDNGANAGFPEMCVVPLGGVSPGRFCSTDVSDLRSEGYYGGDCSGYAVVSVLENPDRLFLQAVDDFGVRQVTYTVTAPTPPPTATLLPLREAR